MAENEISVAIKADASGVKPALSDAKQGMADLATQIAGATQQFSAGTNPMTIFSDHAHDVFSAISQISGVTSGFIGFMGGPWGTVIGAAAGVVGTLISSLSKNDDITKHATISTDAFGDAQRKLAPLIDATTGAIKSNNLVLRDSIMLQAKRDKIAATAKSQTDLGALGKFGRPSDFSLALNFGGDETGMAIAAASERQTKQLAPVKNVIDRFLNGKLISKQDPTGTHSAIQQIEALGAAGKIARDDVLALQQAFNTIGLDRQNIAAAQQILDTLNSKSVPNEASPRPLASSSKIAANPTSATSHRASSSTPKSEESPVHISGDFSQPLELSSGSKDKFVTDIKSTFQNVGKVVGTTADDQKAKWKSVADSISNAFGSSLQGMIKGTQNFRGMMLNIGNAILGDATKWIQKKVSDFLTGELAQTAATTAGVTTRTGIEATGAATSKGISAASSLTQIGHSAAVAAAGAYAAIAKIPIVGPVLAPIAAAAALAGVIALGKSIFSAEGGMGQVPYDGAMFELHKDEMVLPANLATPMRSMLLGPAANNNGPAPTNGGDTHNYYISAIDGKDVDRFFQKHAVKVARAGDRAYRNLYRPRS